ncbi:MAG: hypothetical protein ABI441_10025 [Flavobacterium sp.]
MKNLKNLKGVEVLSKNEQKSINGGGLGPVACYCPGTNIFAGISYDGEAGCGSIIDQNCELDS